MRCTERADPSRSARFSHPGESTHERIPRSACLLPRRRLRRECGRKLRSADRGSAAFAALRIPVGHPKTAAGALIAVEAVVAVGLLATDGWLFVVFAAAALLLTSGLLIAVVRAHRLGATDDCGCFGDWLPSAIGPRLIVRNAVLTAIAASVLAGAVTAAAVSSPSGFRPRSSQGLPRRSCWAPVGLRVADRRRRLVLVRASHATGRTDAQIPRGAGAVLLPATAEIVDVLVRQPALASWCSSRPGVMRARPPWHRSRPQRPLWRPLSRSM